MEPRAAKCFILENLVAATIRAAKATISAFLYGYNGQEVPAGSENKNAKVVNFYVMGKVFNLRWPKTKQSPETHTHSPHARANQ